MTILGLNPDELAGCVGCGLCLPHCPTYRVTGLESASPRGRINAMRAVEGGAPISSEFTAILEACIQCRGCETACPSSVQYGHMAETAMVAIATRRPITRRVFDRILYRHVLPKHYVLLLGTWALVVAQRLHLVPKRFGVPPISTSSLRRSLSSDAFPTVFLYTGCVMDAWQRDVHRAAMKVMRAMGASVGLPGHGGSCCGALHVHAGRRSDAQRLAVAVVASMPGEIPVVVDSAGCGAALKDYGRLLGTPEAIAFSARVRDFTEWVVETGLPKMLSSTKTVVVQDPCHLRHVQHAETSVRTALSASYRLLETDDDALCCGAGGIYSITHPEIARQVRDRKVAAIRAAAGSDEVTVASANPGCAMFLSAAGLDVRHPAELLAAVIEEDNE